MIDKLSVDILISVADLLSAASDRCNLSATRRHLRIALAPSVFHSVRATNIEQDRAAIAALSAAHGLHFRHMRFQCMLHGNPLEISEVEENADSRARDGLECGDDGRRSEERRDLSASGHGYDNSQGPIFEFVATDILLGKIAPNIRDLTLEFMADQDFKPDGCKWVDDHHGIGGSIYISTEAESFEDAAVAEKTFEWRRVMANIWRAVASNLTIRSLTVRSLPPNITTTWHRPEWAVFVGQLEHLTLDLWGGKSDSDFCSITTNGYQDVLSRQLKTLIFDHAHNLLSLGFVSNEFDTYGGTFIDVGAETAFGSSNMPRLLKFRAENCFFDAPLVEFLRSHASTLETIHLVNCMAAVSLFHQLEEPNPTWKGLFEGILGAEPHNLKDLMVTTRKISIHEIAKWAQQRSLAEQEIIRRIEQKLSEDETYPLFYYGWLDPDYGFVSVAWTFVLESFETGSDLATLERLMGVVRSNREASRLTLQKEHN